MKTMIQQHKNKFLTLSLLALTLFTVSCSDDDDDAPQTIPVVTSTFSNLYAPQTGGQGQPVGGAFVKFNFSQNAIVTDDNSWDIAFRGTTILVNGGTAIGIADEPARTGNGAISTISNVFDDVVAFPDASTFVQDGTGTYAIPIGSGNGWYSYDGATMIISPIAGKVFVVKTHDGKYAKFQILSYYQDAPATPTAASPARYYTFRFAYQANSSTTF